MGVGRRLQDAREARGVTLTALAERTKIPARQLQVLEAEDYHRLPGGIFGRGYVRAVAKALGLDADRLVDEFRQEQQPAEEAPPPPSQRSSRVDAEAFSTEQGDTPRLRLAADDETVEEPRHGGRLIAAMLIAVSVILAVLWLGRDAASNDGADEPATAIADASDSEGVPAPAAPESAPQPRVGTAGAVDPATLPDPPASLPAEPEPDQSAGRVEDGTPGAPLEVVVEAQDRCWVTLQADGRRLAFRMFEAGETMTATARRHVMVRAGKPSALRLTVNGTRAGMGRAGRDREVYLTPANYQDVLGSE